MTNFCLFSWNNSKNIILNKSEPGWTNAYLVSKILTKNMDTIIIFKSYYESKSVKCTIKTKIFILKINWQRKPKRALHVCQSVDLQFIDNIKAFDTVGNNDVSRHHNDKLYHYIMDQTDFKNYYNIYLKLQLNMMI